MELCQMMLLGYWILVTTTHLWAYMAYLSREYRKRWCWSIPKSMESERVASWSLLAAKTNMEVLWEVVKAEAKLVVAKGIKVAQKLCLKVGLKNGKSSNMVLGRTCRQQ